ncbi:MAG: hypothetical protein M3R47_05955 [Chloroflexota bacterium]|nr:hypothetical protein [Chloroflexota bacterium]
MTSNHYDTIIIGAGQCDLTLSFGHPSPKRRGDVLLELNLGCPLRNHA